MASTEKALASLAITTLSGAILYQSCIRASTVYFFELDMTKVVFIGRTEAMCLPFILSVLLYLVYLGTKRSCEIRAERKILEQEDFQKNIQNVVSSSRRESRTCSRRTSFSCTEDIETTKRLRRLLDDIEEQDTIHSQHQRRLSTSDSEAESSTPAGESNDMAGESVQEINVETSTRSRFTLHRVEEPDTTGDTPYTFSRSSSISVPRKISQSEEIKRKISGAVDLSRIVLVRRGSVSTTRQLLSSMPNDDDYETNSACELYGRLANLNLMTYLASALDFSTSDEVAQVELKLDINDRVSEVLALHLPTWICVAAFNVIVNETVAYCIPSLQLHHPTLLLVLSVFLSIGFGIIHQLYGSWLTNDVLAFSSIYIVTSRLQAISFETGVILVVCMAVFDLFWSYTIDLLSTVRKEGKTPLIILIPFQSEQQQGIATLSIMVPGVFLNVLLKYSSMYDAGLFNAGLAAVIGGLALTTLLSIHRERSTPSMVLPGLLAVGVSLYFANNRNQLWKFMIKH